MRQSQAHALVCRICDKTVWLCVEAPAMRVPLIDAVALVDGQVSEVDFFGRSVLVLRSD